MLGKQRQEECVGSLASFLPYLVNFRPTKHLISEKNMGNMGGFWRNDTHIYSLASSHLYVPHHLHTRVHTPTHPHTNTCTQIHKINRYIISSQSNVTSSWQIMSRQKGLIIHFHFMSMCSPLQRSFSLSHTWVLIFLSYIALTTSFSLSSHKYPIKILMECGYIL